MSSLTAVLPGSRAATSAEVQSMAQVVFIVAECAREAREVPSGVLYAVLADRVSHEAYQQVLGVLSRAGLIEVTRSHLIRWIGPEV